MKKYLSLPLFFFLVIVTLLSVGGFGIWVVEKQMKENMAAQLDVVLLSNLESLRIWAEDTKLDAQVLASQPEIRRKLISLFEIAKSSAITPEILRQSEELIWLRKHLGETCKKYGFTGFIVFDNTAWEVGAFLDDALGTRDLVRYSDFYYRSLQGDTVVTPPFMGEIDLPDEKGVFRANWPTMFVSTPVHNDSGEVVGVLAFRLRPEKDFTHILSVSRFRESGETYAVNDRGVFVSGSRFDHQLVSMGLLQPEHSSILNVEIRDPGRNLSAKKIGPEEDPSKWPLTVVARQAIQKKEGVQIDGYNDYRGIPVVGAWTWVPELDIGLITEVDVAEAFRPLKTLMNWFLFLFGLLVFFGGIALLLRSRYAQSQRQTLENEERLTSFINNTFDAVLCIDVFGTIQSVNTAAEKQFGYHSEELLGRNIKMLIPEPYHSQHDGYLRNYLKTGKSRIINMISEVNAQRKNGSTFPMELSVSESVVNGQKSYMGNIRDISGRKEAEKELKHAYAKLEDRIYERTQELRESKNLAEEHNLAKSEFLARMSHELRTPMNAILGFTQLMQQNTKEPLPPSHQNRATQILKAGNHLLELINEVLDLTSIESGKITVSLEPVCVADLIDEVITVVRPLSQNFNIALIDQIASNENIYVLADKTRFKQVLLNLISNAIKYNRSGGSVTLSSYFEDSSSLRIDVTDTGMGIPEDQLGQLFEPFNRLGAENGDIEGTGIGLTISKNLIAVMDGSIGVESTVGEGSTFYISLPVCQSQPNMIEPENTSAQHKDPEHEQETSSFTLLYIEDCQANFQLVEDILTDYPRVKLLAAQHATAGIKMALSQKPDLILMDINLPDIDGIEALRRLKSFEETYDIPVIAMSANAMKKDIDRAMAEGFKTYITKPIDIFQFRSIIEDEFKSIAIP